MTALITNSLLVSSVTAFAEESLNEYSLDTMQQEQKNVM